MQKKKLLFDPVQVAKETEKFYLSGQITAQILVKFREPVLKNILFKITRKSSYQNTLNNILANIRLYISVLRKIIYTYNGNTYTRIATGVENLNIITNEIKNDYNRNYILGNNYLGNNYLGIFI